MYGSGWSYRRSSRWRMSTSIAAIASRPASSSDGRSGTCSTGASVSAIGNVDASGTHAVQRAESCVRRRGHEPVAAIRLRLPSGVQQRCRSLRYVVVGVDLAVGMGNGRADLWPSILEHQHEVDVIALPERSGAISPQVDDLAHARHAQRPAGWHRGAGCTARPRSDRPASPATCWGTSARRTARVPPGHRRRTGNRSTAGSGRA